MEIYKTVLGAFAIDTAKEIWFRCKAQRKKGCDSCPMFQGKCTIGEPGEQSLGMMTFYNGFTHRDRLYYIIRDDATHRMMRWMDENGMRGAYEYTGGMGCGFKWNIRELDRMPEEKLEELLTVKCREILEERNEQETAEDHEQECHK